MSKVNIIGIGSVGCNVASWFVKHKKQYRIFYIDSKKHSSKSFVLSLKTTAEDYEATCPDLSTFFGHIGGLTYVFVSGSNRVAGATLKVLQHLQSCDVNVVYIQAENEVRIPVAGLIFGVLQQYARSGKFSRVILCANKTIEKAFDGMPVIGYYDQINDFIASAIDTLNCFLFNEPILSNIQESLKGARLSTLSFVNLEEKTEVELFPLDLVRERRYYLGVSKEVLKSDKGFHRKVQEYVNQSNQGGQTSYNIYQMEGEKNTIICLQCSPEIQVRVP